MARNDKNPTFSAIVSGVKTPTIAAESINYMHLKAAWRIRHIQMVTPYGWQEISSEKLVHIQGKLSLFESMTWREIFVDSKKQNHPIDVCDFKCPNARKWMEVNMKGQPTLWTLRLSGRERVWGIFSEGAYQIVFWDPDNKICPTEK